jgi:hypothetical protein
MWRAMLVDMGMRKLDREPSKSSCCGRGETGAAHDVGASLCDHDDRRIDHSANKVGHHRRIDHAQSIDAVDAQVPRLPPLTSGWRRWPVTRCTSAPIGEFAI